MNLVTSILSATLLLVSAQITVAEEKGIPYPEGYRNWYHTKTMLIQPGHALENPFQGIHHIYANPKALNGLKNGSFADGSYPGI